VAEKSEMAVNGEFEPAPGDQELEDLASAYFLGRLSDEQRDGVREQLLVRDELVERFEEVENDLVDRYVRGELTPADQLAFERHFPRIEKLRLARLIQTRRKTPSWKRFALPATLAAALVIGAGLVFVRPATQQTSNSLESQTVLFSFSLPPGTTRDATARELDLPRDATLIEIRLGLEPPIEHLSYTAVLKNQRGEAVFSARNLLARKPPAALSVDMHVAAQILSPGSYEVTLYGLRTDGADELIDYYSFRVR
jgi:hypothetical protein